MKIRRLNASFLFIQITQDIIRYMKVSELEIGQIYIRDEPTVTFDRDHTICGSVHAPIIHVTERMLWRSYRKRYGYESGPEVYIYLGATNDDWHLRDPGIGKHHWFLVDGQKLVVNNYCIKMLRKIDNVSL